MQGYVKLCTLNPKPSYPLRQLMLGSDFFPILNMTQEIGALLKTSRGVSEASSRAIMAETRRFQVLSQERWGRERENLRWTNTFLVVEMDAAVCKSSCTCLLVPRSHGFIRV